MKIKAAVLECPGQDLAVIAVNKPSLMPGQVFVKIYYSGVCRSQLMEVRGLRGPDPWLPHMLGHEAVGEVVEIGDAVSKVTVGDKVILTWIKCAGCDALPATYRTDTTEINSGKVTTFSDYSIVSENRLTKKPDHMPLDLAVLFGCALATGGGMILHETSILPTSTCCVIGLGGVGLSAVLALMSRGVTDLIVVDKSEAKLSMVRGWGVKHTINSTNSDVLNAVKGLTKARNGVDFCIEAGGTAATIEQGFSVIRCWGGKLLFASHPPAGETIQLNPHELLSGKQIQGTWGGGIDPDYDVPMLYDQLSKYDDFLYDLIDRRYALSEINLALNDLEAGRVVRPLIDMGHGTEH